MWRTFDHLLMAFGLVLLCSVGSLLFDYET